MSAVGDVSLANVYAKKKKIVIISLINKSYIFNLYNDLNISLAVPTFSKITATKTPSALGTVFKLALHKNSSKNVTVTHKLTNYKRRRLATAFAIQFLDK